MHLSVALKPALLSSKVGYYNAGMDAAHARCGGSGCALIVNPMHHRSLLFRVPSFFSVMKQGDHPEAESKASRKSQAASSSSTFTSFTMAVYLGIWYAKVQSVNISSFIFRMFKSDPGLET